LFDNFIPNPQKPTTRGIFPPQALSCTLKTLKHLVVKPESKKEILEMIWARYLKLLSKLGLAVRALGALATTGRTQTVYQGKFRLPFETHWGGATLAAGDYTFTMASASSSYTLYIHGQAGDAIILAAAADENVVSSRPQLNLVDISDVENVNTVEAPQLGLTFSYSTPKQIRAGRKEARQNTMPQTTPASQMDENAASIQVYSAGR
jgi:hypothetical protein